MPIGRRIGFLMAVVVGLAGCRADGTGSLSLIPRRNPSPLAFNVEEFVAEHNRNADLIESLQAKPSIDVSSGRLGHVNVNGRMAMERPRNFKLELEAQGIRQADLGSNPEEFWFWMANADKEGKWIYWCNYRDLPSSDLRVTYQPDWIVEAMGLTPITPGEATGIRAERGRDGNTTLLTFPPTLDRGSPYTREMVVSNTDLRIKKLRIFSGNPRSLIAESQTDEYQTYPAGKARSSSGETCYLPKKMKLQWKREGLVLDVALNEATINQFDHTMAAGLFVEPQQPGYSRMNLADMSRSARAARRTRTRQTMPPPGADDDHPKLFGRPAPMKDDQPVVPKVGRRVPRSPASGDDAPSSTLEQLVGTPIPQPPGTGPIESASLPGIPGRDSSIER